MLLGDNTFGQLGMGDYEARDAPRVVHLALREEDVACVACGRAHTLAVTQRGEVYAWGCGGQGRLGLEVADAVSGSDASSATTPTHALPALVEGLRGVCIVQVVCGSAAKRKAYVTLLSLPPHHSLIRIASR
jgi:alpha-tubulin suppressor-like RCC1 family protein